MEKFRLDSRLEQDCHLLGKRDDTHVLLMDNALFPWFILVPETEHQELYLLPGDQKDKVYKRIDQFSLFLKERLRVDKLNVAAIGNIVNQLHIHIVGRRHDDPCWPGVVWGLSEKKPYSRDQLNEIKKEIESAQLV